MTATYVILDDFGRHVHRSSRETVVRAKIAEVGYARVCIAASALNGPLILRQDLCSAKIDVLDDALVIEEDVCGASAYGCSNAKRLLTVWLDVAMDNTHRVKICKTLEHLHSVDLDDALVFYSAVLE